MRYATIQSFLFLAVNLEKPVFLHPQKLKFPVKNLMKMLQAGSDIAKRPIRIRKSEQWHDC